MPPALHTLESDEREDEAETTGHDAIAVTTPAVERAEHRPHADSEETLRGEEAEEEEEEEESPDPDTDDADMSDAESFTLKDRQEAINETHPFGIRIWKPALYKKSRSVQRNAEGDIHSAPGGNVSRTLFIFNFAWTLIFGWWLCLVAASGGLVCMILAIFRFPGCYEYGRVLISLAHYIFYPFGKYVRLERDEAYVEEDEGEGRSITEYERWQTGDLEEGRLFFGPTDINRSLIGRRRDEVPGLDENDSLLGRPQRPSSPAERLRNKAKKRLFGRGKWNLGRVIFFLSFYFLITPCLFLVSCICWFFVFTIPMGKVTLLLFYHLRRHPLAMSFHTDSHYMRSGVDRGTSGSSILLCTYRAVGLRYWKYTVDGTNVFLINLLALVFFVIFDYYVLFKQLGIVAWFTNQGFVFALALASIIPLAYFIGQAVASISAQSSMGVGATVNAAFATIVEVFLYCAALMQGKSALVEGSIVGSIFAGILFLPGISMCFGAIKRKTQRFNVKSAGATTTMLLFAVIGAFTPTLFYQIYGSHEMKCHQCLDTTDSGRDCRRCYFSQTPAIRSRFYQEAVQPFIWAVSLLLFISYIVGLLFTLRTHAAVIWNNEPDEKKDVKMEQAAHRVEERHLSSSTPMPESARATLTRQSTAATLGVGNVRDSQMYKRILNQSLKQAGVGNSASQTVRRQDDSVITPHMVPPKSPEEESGPALRQRIQGLSVEDNRALVQEIAEMAAMAATVAARDATAKATRKPSFMGSGSQALPRHQSSASSKDTKDSKDASKDTVKHHPPAQEPSTLGFESDLQRTVTGAAPAPPEDPHDHQEEGGHDAPNWSRVKSYTILFTATIAYAIIAEILVSTVDAVLSNVDVDEKFLGITLFALVPNTTEFLNAIAFAMNGNVALSMEIGSSYALQVMLLQIPTVVVFSAVYGWYFLDVPDAQVLQYSFTLIFPQWDMVVVILGVFFMGWVVAEGKSNYFKGSTLIFTYVVFVVGFWFSGFDHMDVSSLPSACSIFKAFELVLMRPQTNNLLPDDPLALGSSPTFQQTFVSAGKGRAYPQ